MKNKIMKFLLIPSGITMMASLFVGNKNQVLLFLIYLIIGFILGLLPSLVKTDKHIPINRAEYVIGIFMALLLCILNAKSFYNTWTASPTMQSLLNHIFPEPDFGLIILCVIIGIFTFPFLAYIMPSAAAWIVQLFKLLEFRKILHTFKKRVSLRIFLTRTLVAIINLAAATLIGMGLLMAAYSLPISPIDANVGASALTIQKEGAYPTLYSWCQSRLDNYTDALMLLESADNTKASLLEKSMNIYHGAITGSKHPADVLVSHYINGTSYTGTSGYARYWHGYLIFLKPLLEFFDYSKIRIINGIIQLILFLAVCMLMYRKGLKPYIIPYFICYLMLMPIALAKSLQFSSCYYVSIVGVLVLLSLPEKMRNKYAYIIFLYIGIATAFFDFLTYPIATFGLPAVIFIVLSKKDSLETKIYSIVRNGILWCIGYGGMWMSKWIIASAATGDNVIENALASLKFRTSTRSIDGLANFTVSHCEIINFSFFINTPFTLLVVAFLVTAYIKNNCQDYDMAGKIILPYAIISLAPVAWYAFAVNHSSIHVFFTNKACVVTLMALLFGVTDSLLHTSYPVAKKKAS